MPFVNVLCFHKIDSGSESRVIVQRAKIIPVIVYCTGHSDLSQWKSIVTFEFALSLDVF